MQSLDVYKYLNTLARLGGDDLSHARERPVLLNKTFKGGTFNIHVFTGHAECIQILRDTHFIQPKLADVISEVFGALGSQAKVIEDFLRNNPIAMDGAAHCDARQLFLAEYRSAQPDLSGALPSIAKRAFSEFIDQDKSSILTGLVEPYVDAAVETILDSYNSSLQVSRNSWRGNSSCIFEYFHPIRKLKQRDLQASALADQLESEFDSKDEGAEAIPILLTYVLQGRDPLIGALCGYMHSCLAMDEDERNSNIAAIDARELFWRTSPVNYTGRIATRSGTVGNTHVESGDHAVLVLSWANHDAGSAKSSLAFGAGPHICAGQGLALAIADAWLCELKSRHERIRWRAIRPDQLIPAVFREYRTQSND